MTYSSAPYVCWDETSAGFREGGREIILQTGQFASRWGRGPGSDLVSVHLSMGLLFISCADIEELTSKTGNFKQFAVFLNMLESAITKVLHNSLEPRLSSSFSSLAVIASNPGSHQAG